jgi:hypothetical protein
MKRIFLWRRRPYKLPWKRKIGKCLLNPKIITARIENDRTDDVVWNLPPKAKILQVTQKNCQDYSEVNLNSLKSIELHDYAVQLYKKEKFNWERVKMKAKWNLEKQWSILQIQPKLGCNDDSSDNCIDKLDNNCSDISTLEMKRQLKLKIDVNSERSKKKQRVRSMESEIYVVESKLKVHAIIIQIV